MLFFCFKIKKNIVFTQKSIKKVWKRFDFHTKKNIICVRWKRKKQRELQRINTFYNILKKLYIYNNIIMKTITDIQKTSYGQYDIQNQKVKDFLKDNWYILFYDNTATDEAVAGMEYIAEWFDGWDDSYIGSTAYAKTARPVIVDIYKKKENYEEERAKKLEAFEKAEAEEKAKEQEEKEKLQNWEYKIEVSVEEMKRGYSLKINTENFKKYSMKQKYVKELEKTTKLEKEELCRYIEANYNFTSSFNLKIDWEIYRLDDLNYNY